MIRINLFLIALINRLLYNVIYKFKIKNYFSFNLSLNKFTKVIIDVYILYIKYMKCSSIVWKKVMFFFSKCFAFLEFVWTQFLSVKTW